MQFTVRRARLIGTFEGAGGIAVSSAAPYVGPGDITSAWTAWWGLRAYSAAYAAGVSKPCCDVKRASDSTTQTINILSNGDFDVASLNTFINATTGNVTKWYDQTGHGHHLSNSGGPTIVTSGSGLTNVNNTAVLNQFDNFGQLDYTGTVSFTQPYTASFVLRPHNLFANGPFIMGDSTGAAAQVTTGASSFYVIKSNGSTFGTSGPNAAVVGTWVSLKGFFNSSTPNLYVNNSAQSGGSLGSGSLSSSIKFFQDFSNNFTDIALVESGLGTFDTTVVASLTSNERNYWGF
jgi:hypothetical protein